MHDTNKSTKTLKMENLNNKLSEKEKIEQENFVIQSKLMIQGNAIMEFSELDPELKNLFLKNVLAIEEAESVSVYKLLNIKHSDFPKVEELNNEQIEVEFKRLIKLLEKYKISYCVNEDVPMEISYRYLTEDYLFSEMLNLPHEFGWTIDGCSGDCPRCFQADYCKNKDKIWSEKEFNEERNRRKLQ